MSFLKGSSQIHVFKVVTMPDIVQMAERTEATTFTTELLTEPGNLTDAATFFRVGGILAIGMRVDEKKAPAKLVKIELAKQIREVMTSRGLERISRKHKQEIKEAVIERLALDAHPSISSADMVFDGARLFVFGTASMADRIVQLIHRAGGELERVELHVGCAILSAYGLTRDGSIYHGDPVHRLIVDKASLLDTMGMTTVTTDIGTAQRMVQENAEDYSVTQCLIEVRTADEEPIGKALVKIPTSPGGSVQLAITPPVSEGADDDAKILDRFEGFKRIYSIVTGWVSES